MTTDNKPTTKKRRMYRTYYGPVIKLLFGKFINPFIRAVGLHDLEESLNSGVREFFNVDTRHVHFAIAIRDFTIPGKEWLNNTPRMLGYTKAPRRVLRDHGVVLRFDDLTPNRVELEFNEVVFVMDKSSWKLVEDRVEIVD